MFRSRYDVTAVWRLRIPNVHVGRNRGYKPVCKRAGSVSSQS
ncbi:MAG: hypothetical protein QXK38_06265 [Candidatus Caldarchaeum sp.]